MSNPFLIDQQPERSTVPPGREAEFRAWLRRNQITDLDHPDSHYDYRGAFLAGINRGVNGHWPDTYKQHGHPTFSVESQYAQPGDTTAGRWEGDSFIPPTHDNPFLKDSNADENPFLAPQGEEKQGGVGRFAELLFSALGEGVTKLGKHVADISLSPVLPPGVSPESTESVMENARQTKAAVLPRFDERVQEIRDVTHPPESGIAGVAYGLGTDLPTFLASEALSPELAAGKAATFAGRVLRGMGRGAEVGVPYSVLSGRAGEPGVTGLPGIVEDPATFAAASPPFTAAGEFLGRLLKRGAAEAAPAATGTLLPEGEVAARNARSAEGLPRTGVADEMDVPTYLRRQRGNAQISRAEFDATAPEVQTAPGALDALLAPETPPPGTYADEAIAQPTKVELTPAGPVPVGQGGFINRGAITNFIRRNFRTGGNLPKELWQHLLTRDGGINASERELTFNIRELMRGAGESYGFGARFRLPDEAVNSVNAYLRGQAPIETLPEAMRAPALNIRSHVDALSQKLIDSGAAEGKMALTITANKGVYLTRTYQLFENPRWAAYAAEHPEMEPVRQKAMALLRSQNPDLVAREQAGDRLATGELQAMFNDLLAKPEEGPFSILARRPGLAKNLSILQRRSDIPAEIRALWGEIDSPMAAYARSVEKMSTLLETHKALTEMRDAGMGKFFFTADMRGMAPEATALMAGEGSQVLSPLNGLYTYPEIAQSLKDFTTNAPVGAFVRQWVKLNAATKFGKVILNHVALMRNMLSNIGFAMTQGHWRVMKFGAAAKALMAEMNPLGLSGFARDIGFNERKWQEYVLDLQRRGVIGDAARAHELKDIMQEVAKSGHWLDELGDQLPAKFAKKIVRGATEVYRAGDDVWKIFAYENELARYRGALKAAGASMPEEELKNKVAENVRLTYPTYSNIPRAIRGLRRFPLLGPFVSFPWEVYRSAVATVGLAMQEMQNPALASVGRARLTSAALSLGVGFAGVAAFTKHINGITNETEEAMRRFLPPWSQNSTLAYLNHDEDGNARVIDLSYTDPYSYVRDVVTAALRGEDWHAKALNSAGELLRPFASPELLTGAVFNATKLWQDLPPEMPLAERMERVGNVLYQAFEPGSVAALQRLVKATQNPGNPYDQKYDPEVEKLVNTTGMRVTEVNPLNGLVFRARDYSKALDAARQEELRTARSRQPISDEDLLHGGQLAATIRDQAFADMRQDVEAARVLGKTDFEIRRSLMTAGLPAQEINAVILGLPRIRIPKFNIEPGDPLAPELIRRQLILQQNAFLQEQ